MTPNQMLLCIISPTLSLLPGALDSPAAEVMLLAIALQESRLVHRRQINGPARGYWQFELGGVRGVLNHHAARDHAAPLCSVLGYAADDGIVYGAIEHNDVLACAFARLLLYSDPQRLPKLGAESAAWDYYLRNWRPGRPHPETWPEMYRRALEAVQ
jgi:hypothetical protein